MLSFRFAREAFLLARCRVNLLVHARPVYLAMLSCLAVAPTGCAGSDAAVNAESEASAERAVPPPELNFLRSGELDDERASAGAAEGGLETPLRPGESTERDNAAPMRSAHPDDPDQVIRRWMIGDTAAPTLPGKFAGTADDPVLQSLERDPWIRYLSIDTSMPAGEREEALREILDLPLSDALRQLVLLDIASDASFQSRRADFIRRYGFYANWFNRLTYATSRAVQGNVQAVGQVVVDAVFDRIGSEEVTPAERRIYKLLREMEREGRSTRSDRERMAELEARINEAFAEADLEKAEFALEQNDPDLARFYARGAQARLPESRTATKLENEAESEIAARRRRFLASSQVGYPDREPPFRLDEPELLRASLSRRHSDLIGQLEQHEAAVEARHRRKKNEPLPEGPEPLDPGQEFLARLLASLPDQNQSATLAMRQWAGTLQDAGYAPEEETLWLKRLLQDPRFNPDLRLARAQSSRRGHLASFIFLGPESARERAYTFTSRLTSAFDALAGIGVFYVFEVFYRTGVVALSPPPPREEMFDAAAAYIRASPADRSSRKTAAWLIEQYLDAGRFDRARDILDRYGELDREKSEELFEMEARRLYAMGSAAPPGSPEQAYLLGRAVETAPGTKIASRAAKKLAEAEAAPGEPWQVEAAWESIGRWFNEPLPGPFPGKPQWFDGSPANGEITRPTFSLEGEGSRPESVLLTYAVRENGRQDYVQEWLLLESYPSEVREWIGYLLRQRDRVQRETRRWDRPRIPYSVVGGVGLSGVDFYPKLRPIETQADEFDLYQSPE